MNRSSQWAATTALVLLVGCPSDKPSAPAASAPTVVSTPAKGPSPLDAATTTLSKPLADATRPHALMDQAEALIAWANDQTGEAQSKAALAATRLQLIAVVLAAGPSDLGESPNTLLRRIATNTTLTAGDQPEGHAATRLKEAALAILGLDVEVKDVRINRSAALELATSPTLAGQAVRAAWLARVDRSLKAWDTLPPELRASVAVPLSGRMLCPRCADAHHITPDKVVSLLLGKGNAGGLICDRAIAAGVHAKTPQEQLGALSLCDELWPTSNSADPGLFWGTNVLVLGVLRTAKALLQAPPPSGPLTALMNARTEAVKARLKRPWVLPTALVTGPSRADDARSPLLFIANLGGAGLTTSHPPLGVVSLGPEGLRMGLRPTVTFTDDTPGVESGSDLVSLSLVHGLPAGGRQILSLEELRSASKQPDGAIDAVSSALNEIYIAARDINQKLGREGEVTKNVTLVVDAESTASDAIRALDALRAGGVETAHVLKAASHGHTLPLMVREEAAGTRTVLNTAPIVAHERPMLAVVTDTRVDVWAPAGPQGEPTQAAPAGKPPEGAEFAYKDQRLVRIRVAIADPVAGVQATGLTAVNRAASYFQRRDGAGALLHVIAGKGARAADVVLVSRSFQERPGTPLATPHVFWPGTRCGGEDYKALRRTTSDCATGVAVAFSSMSAPSSRGLSDRPVGARRPTKSSDAASEPPAAPMVSDEFCDKGDIRVAMNRNKGSFRFCYQRELQSTPELAGRVVLRFTIGTDGRPKGASIGSSSLGNKAAHGCILKTLKRMTFKPPKGGICPVRWPFNFQPR